MSSSHKKRQRPDAASAETHAAPAADASIADLRRLVDGLDPRRARQLQGQVGNAALQQILGGAATQDLVARATRAAATLRDQQALEAEEEQEHQEEEAEAERQEQQRTAAADVAPSQSGDGEPVPGEEVLDAVVRMAGDLLFDGEEDDEDDDTQLPDEKQQAAQRRQRQRWLPERTADDPDTTPAGRTVRKTDATGDARTACIWPWLQDPAALVDAAFQLEDLLEPHRVHPAIARIVGLALWLGARARHHESKALLDAVGPVPGAPGLAALVTRNAALVDLAIATEPRLAGAAALMLEPARAELDAAAAAAGLGVRATSLQLLTAAARGARDAQPPPGDPEPASEALRRAAGFELPPVLDGFPFPARRGEAEDPVERALAGPDRWKQAPPRTALDGLVQQLGGVLEGLLRSRREVAAAGLAMWRLGAELRREVFRDFEEALQPLGRALVVHAEQVARSGETTLQQAEPTLRNAIAAADAARSQLLVLRNDVLQTLAGDLPAPGPIDPDAAGVARALLAGDTDPAAAAARHAGAAWTWAILEAADRSEDAVEALRPHRAAALAGAPLAARLAELGAPSA